MWNALTIIKNLSHNKAVILISQNFKNHKRISLFIIIINVLLFCKKKPYAKYKTN